MTLRTHPISALGGAVAVLASLAIVGCGAATTDADPVNGKTLFVEKCAACHTLARANTQGVQGPNLDQAFSRARADGMTSSTFAGVVEQQILFPNSAMPADLVTGQDARDVAAYVARAVAVPGKDEGALAQAGQPEEGKPVKANAGNELQIDAVESGAPRFIAAQASAAPGVVELVMNNPSSTPHNIALRDGGVDAVGEVVSSGGVSKVSAKLKPGKYTFYCSVPGHEAGGMKGALTVK